VRDEAVSKTERSGGDPTTPKGHADQLARVAADLEVRNLIARVAHLADDGDLDEYALLFTEDSSWEFPGAPRRGRADILVGAQARRSEKLTGPGSSSRHVITTTAVRVVDQATALGDSYWLFFRETTTSPVLAGIGHYHDTARCEDGVWRIARREITFG
jgi:uncharacterized protein (TIGR02246 family)